MKPKLWVGDYIYEDEPSISATTLHEPESETFTGLYDANGDPLHRQKEPVGFRIRS